MHVVKRSWNMIRKQHYGCLSETYDEQHEKKSQEVFISNRGNCEVKICNGPSWISYDLLIYISHINKVVLDFKKQ